MSCCVPKTTAKKTKVVDLEILNVWACKVLWYENVIEIQNTFRQFCVEVMSFCICTILTYFQAVEHPVCFGAGD